MLVRGRYESVQKMIFNCLICCELTTIKHLRRIAISGIAVDYARKSDH
jgi:hypothetical protein